MQLVIANKNYSSWSMRPWVLLRHFGIPFQETRLRFDRAGQPSAFKTQILALSPAGKVPALIDEDGFIVWDSLAIAEALADRFPQHAMWPRDARQRARARSMCAEMHSGFTALRSHCPMNIEAALPEVGARVLKEQPGVAADLARIVTLWTEALAASGGPFLFGAFGIVDAYYAPVVARLRTYALPVPPDVQRYMDAVWASPGVAAWVADALAEHDFIEEDEPYRQRP